MQRKIVPSRESLEPLFKAFEPEDPQKLGYWFSAWNGKHESAQRISMTSICGSVPRVPELCNNLVLSLPRPSDVVASLYDPPVLLGILEAVANAWEPDWAVLSSDQFCSEYGWRDDDDERSPGKPYLGWMTYLRARRLGGLAGTPPCEVVDIPDRGAIFVVTREHRFAVENPADVARAQRLTEYLEACGALVPIPTNEPF